MPPSDQGFDASNLRPLLEYLEQTCGDSDAHYRVALSINEHTAIEQRVQGYQRVIALFEPSHRVHKITWRYGDMKVIIDCDKRELTIHTASIHFIEICRHTMTGQGVRKIKVHLKPE